jgi:FAD binding domain
VWKSAYRFHQRIADRFRIGRIFLLGDAAPLSRRSTCAARRGTRLESR